MCYQCLRISYRLQKIPYKLHSVWSSHRKVVCGSLDSVRQERSNSAIVEGVKRFLPHACTGCVRLSIVGQVLNTLKWQLPPNSDRTLCFGFFAGQRLGRVGHVQKSQEDFELPPKNFKPLLLYHRKNSLSVYNLKRNLHIQARGSLSLRQKRFCSVTLAYIHKARQVGPGEGSFEAMDGWLVCPVICFGSWAQRCFSRFFIPAVQRGLRAPWIFARVKILTRRTCFAPALWK